MKNYTKRPVWNEAQIRNHKRKNIVFFVVALALILYSFLSNAFEKWDFFYREINSTVTDKRCDFTSGRQYKIYLREDKKFYIGRSDEAKISVGDSISKLPGSDTLRIFRLQEGKYELVDSIE